LNEYFYELIILIVKFVLWNQGAISNGGRLDGPLSAEMQSMLQALAADVGRTLEVAKSFGHVEEKFE